MPSKRFLVVISLLLLAAVVSACAGARTPVAAVQQEADQVVEAPGVTPQAAVATAPAEEAAPAGEEKPVKIGVIQITLEHEYQITLNNGFKAKAEEMGAETVFCINELNPEKHVKCGEDLIAAGVNAIIQAPADPASFKAVADMAKAKGIPVINDGSPQPKMDGVVPFIGTDSLGGGYLAGVFAGNWINENLGGKAIVATLDLPTFTDCVARVDGFEKGLAETAPEAEIVVRQNGYGLRPKALEVMENILQGNPEIDVVFGCNDDSALGAMSAMEAAGKDPAKSLVIGFDGTNDAFRAIQAGGMFRADIVQRPDLISRTQMEIAINIARGKAKVEDFPAPTYIKTPVVTVDNVDAWMEWGGDPAMAPTEEAAVAPAGEEKPVKIGVIQITLEHEYQITLNNGFKAKAEEMGAETVFCINELNPEKHVKCGEDLIAAGVNAIIQAPADPASFKAVADMAKAKGIPVINDGSPQPKMDGVVPFIGTDSLGGGYLAGVFAGNWINENLGGKAIVATLDLPTFTDCVARVDGFEKGLAETAPEAEIVVRQNGYGLRPKALEVMENILQGNPEIDVVFGCNDDSALGAMSAMEAAGKDPAKSLVIGFDGTNDAFRAIQAGGMFRADIVQRPDLISRTQMEIAINIARGKAKVEDFPAPTYIKTPVVTVDNVDAWMEWGGDPAMAPTEEAAAAPAEGKQPVTVGVIQITLEHEYQITLNNGFKAKAEELGAETIFCINELNPEKHVKCGEDLLAAGVDALIQAPADPASFKAVADMFVAKGIPVINDGSPQPKMDGVVPFIGTDSLGGGELAGQFAGNWINENLGGKAVVATLDLPTFTDCVARVDGFEKGLAATAPEAEIVVRQNGYGLRPKALEVMENILQGNPEIDVVFGCNDDSALGAMSAMEAAGKDPTKSLVIGFDGTNDAFRAIQAGGMFRADIVQRPDLISRTQMDIAVKIARGEAEVEDYPNPTYIKTPVVTTENVDAWMEWGGDPAKAPQ